MEQSLNADQISSIRGMLNSSKTYVTNETQRLSEVRELNEATESLLEENESLKAIIEKQNKEIKLLKKEIANSSGKKFLKEILHKYLLNSIKKGIARRSNIKSMVAEIMNLAMMKFSGKAAILFEHFDDEKESTINIERVNDIHDNATVTI